MEELKLHDIKGFVEIPDNSIYYFYTLITLAILALLLAIYFLIKYIKREKAVDMQKLYRETLEDLNLKESKDTAYKLSHFGELLEKDEAQSSAFAKLNTQLEPYKYQKEVPNFNEDDTKAIQNFLEAIHV